MNSAAEAVTKVVPATASSSAVPIVPDLSEKASAPTPTAPAAAFLLQPTGETALSPAGVSRLDSSAHVIERMLNQNTYDDIAQGFIETRLLKCLKRLKSFWCRF